MSESKTTPVIGIAQIGVYIPEHHLSNYDRQEDFGIDAQFIETKLGVKQVTRKGEDEETSDMCVAAFRDLCTKVAVDPAAVDCLVVCTQNPDGHGIPHTSAVVHAKLEMGADCAAFDISLGCSGYVYALSVVQAFMAQNGMQTGLLFTADPYSKILDPDDRNTVLLFGDAATVTLLTAEPQYVATRFAFGTMGNEGEALQNDSGQLYMNGRAVFSFSATRVPAQIRRLLEQADLAPDDIDLYLLHQGSKYIVDTITKRLKLPAEKVPLNFVDHGNTVSSSIPLLLHEHLVAQPEIEQPRQIILSGFGVGLSWATALLQMVNTRN